MEQESRRWGSTQIEVAGRIEVAAQFTLVWESPNTTAHVNVKEVPSREGQAPSGARGLW